MFSKVFHGFFKSVSKKMKGVLRALEGCFKDVSMVF